jgi:hypothetical protein
MLRRALSYSRAGEHRIGMNAMAITDFAELILSQHSTPLRSVGIAHVWKRPVETTSQHRRGTELFGHPVLVWFAGCCEAAQPSLGLDRADVLAARPVRSRSASTTVCSGRANSPVPHAALPGLPRVNIA